GASFPSVWYTSSCFPLPGSSRILQQESPPILYPELLKAETVSCPCHSENCDFVYWFRTLFNDDSVQFLVSCNLADRCTHGSDIVQSRFKVSSSKGSFSLRIADVTKQDAGIYSCVVKVRGQEEVWRPAAVVRPGEKAPTTVKPTTKRKPPVVPVCRCSKTKKPQANSCGSMVLWPLVGLIAVLAVVLIGTLYYFSRLPKKCRHNFVK
uniref:Cd8 beta n=1 Tax=Myripristis murdjan TaxID=586833 RepID=A0A667WW71_9TELE